MTTLHETQDDVTQLQTTVYGVQGQGGLTHRVEKLETVVQDHEKRLNVLSTKWLILMLLAGAVGNSLGAYIIKTLTNFP